jgi:hypothetical protein
MCCPCKHWPSKDTFHDPQSIDVWQILEGYHEASWLVVSETDLDDRAWRSLFPVKSSSADFIFWVSFRNRDIALLWRKWSMIPSEGWQLRFCPLSSNSSFGFGARRSSWRVRCSSFGNLSLAGSLQSLSMHGVRDQLLFRLEMSKCITPVTVI